ncbi:transglycosylase SLT domain-containing protein [Dactylosporangium aurantiacum]|uniref:Transglycosylase SLT domain-containing protein n=1 Tax=Dactylosporangium aurantiacum TaxID=35754 RepID=A0A9Q9MLD0_9ACTN|nr:transglycosylase SLT domain-containing protein [Dactylosporangium aurantiacum]MDG6102025.1 transglycosylase SLT domain-containing protein [Dactylosporangium aurantiacum]UWZ53637.1 transglycosylase SLT domain-containing protein [Dactylosporangium aurantiacum]
MTVYEAQARVAQIRSRFGLPAAAATGGGDAFAAALRSTVAGGPATGTAVVEAAKRYLGTPYVFGGSTPESGLDCSGLVQRVYADLGVKLPRVAKDQARQGTAVPDLAHARPGDLLAFGDPVDHVAIYAGDGRMIAAPHAGDVVKSQQVYETPTAIRRIVPAAWSDTLSGGALSAGAPAVAPVGGGSMVAAAALRPAALNGVPYAELFQQAGAKYGLPAALLAAVAKVESGYNPAAVSGAGAQGLMQLMPATARGLGVNALDPAQAVDGAARMLSANLDRFGSVELALAAYNAGGGAVSRYGGIPPFAQTQAYVPKVKAAMEQLAGRGFA